MDVRQSFFDYLDSHGAKQKIESIIRDGIDEWKKKQAYRYDPYDNDPGDFSGSTHMIPGKTIGDITETDMDVLKAYTGDWEATHVSHYGKRHLLVADRISSSVMDRIYEFRSKFIDENKTALLEQYGIIPDDDWTEDDVFETIEEAISRDECSMNYEWMARTFPEYDVVDEDVPMSEYLFDILG